MSSESDESDSFFDANDRLSPKSRAASLKRSVAVDVSARGLDASEGFRTASQSLANKTQDDDDDDDETSDSSQSNSNLAVLPEEIERELLEISREDQDRRRRLSRLKRLQRGESQQEAEVEGAFDASSSLGAIPKNVPDVVSSIGIHPQTSSAEDEEAPQSNPNRPPRKSRQHQQRQKSPNQSSSQSTSTMPLREVEETTTQRQPPTTSSSPSLSSAASPKPYPGIAVPFLPLAATPSNQAATPPGKLPFYVRLALISPKSSNEALNRPVNPPPLPLPAPLPCPPNRVRRREKDHTSFCYEHVSKIICIGLALLFVFNMTLYSYIFYLAHIEGHEF